LNELDHDADADLWADLNEEGLNVRKATYMKIWSQIKHLGIRLESDLRSWVKVELSDEDD
jgi:hypothetical protein